MEWLKTTNNKFVWNFVFQTKFRQFSFIKNRSLTTQCTYKRSKYRLGLALFWTSSSDENIFKIQEKIAILEKSFLGFWWIFWTWDTRLVQIKFWNPILFSIFVVRFINNSSQSLNCRWIHSHRIEQIRSHLTFSYLRN